MSRHLWHLATYTIMHLYITTYCNTCHLRNGSLHRSVDITSTSTCEPCERYASGRVFAFGISKISPAYSQSKFDVVRLSRNKIFKTRYMSAVFLELVRLLSPCGNVTEKFDNSYECISIVALYTRRTPIGCRRINVNLKPEQNKEHVGDSFLFVDTCVADPS